ncbi:GHMP kinase [Leptobacterium flavescens]|uniref:GHMP kinase n=1 Tax=Leptobacterium flavescens TaxID=472055 RepID=A0A6P0UVE8_9FLAO|nr:GYDIA family GHMP kinase [Leptobacterium flavescens]NER14783.1 GHMP kinase [Leptobacterium flavescens]
MQKEYYSHGKLLLTGEYVVLDGALSLALPTTYGQSLKLREVKKPELHWKSLDEKGETWFEGTFELSGIHFTATDKDIADVLIKILKEARKLNPEFLKPDSGFEVLTKLDFPRNWGLGSSSTLINNIAQWAGVDPYTLLWNAFSGSGYDIACARSSTPLSYRLEGKKAISRPVNFDPSFKDSLFFVHLNKKQNSREGIARYRSFKNESRKNEVISAVSRISSELSDCDSLELFENHIKEHEQLISSLIELPTVKEQLFPDYFGELKSLGAWGGDFILATGNEETAGYFKSKGFETVIPYSNMILNIDQ